MSIKLFFFKKILKPFLDYKNRVFSIWPVVCGLALLEIQQFSKYDLMGRKYKLTSQISDILIKRRKIFHAPVGKANATHSQFPKNCSVATIHTQ